MTAAIAELPFPKALYRLEEAMEILSLSRSVLYREIHRGRIMTVTVNRCRRIPATAITEYVTRLIEEAEAA
ncbi:helix-turn-helix domain-containing protein [Actinocorallia longicatena]|uniref:Helix-turn-helix domain-containing protein n=1 Tax=Actinocorallia longicatena TaxID=111803 RepID=A0ABP6QDU8_9ACTN